MVDDVVHQVSSPDYPSLEQNNRNRRGFGLMIWKRREGMPHKTSAFSAPPRFNLYGQYTLSSEQFKNTATRLDTIAE